MDNHNNVHGGHRERLRQRLIAEGADHFEPHELLEFLLYYAIPRQNVNMLAHELLNYFGNLRNVLNAEIQELTQVKGMGEHAARWLNLVGKSVNVCAETESGAFLNLSNKTLVVRSILEMHPRPEAPCLMQLCLNRNNALLYRRILCSSRKWGEPEILREGIRDVFSSGARNVILVLFPNGASLEPTQYDLDRVNAYAAALKTADSNLLDLILFEGDRHHSLRSSNLIPELSNDSKTRLACREYLSESIDHPEGDVSPIHHF